MNISVAEAKAKFSEIVKKVEAGEEVQVTRHGKVVAKMIPPVEAPIKRSIVGLFKDEHVWMSDDFNDPLPDFDEYMPSDNV